MVAFGVIFLDCIRRGSLGGGLLGFPLSLVLLCSLFLLCLGPSVLEPVLGDMGQRSGIGLEGLGYVLR